MLKPKLQYLATWCEELTYRKRPRCWERVRAGGEGGDGGWDGWMASPTWWTWVWVDSGSWWWTGKPGVLPSMGSQRVGHDWATNTFIPFSRKSSAGVLCRVHHVKYPAGWITSWNQDWWEKYQQPQICRWYHSNGRKWRGTKEPFDEGERGKWKSWLQTQHSEKLKSWHPVPSLHGKQMRKKWKQWQILFS